MKNEWIIDVLADLNSFAKANGYPALAKQLEETAILASVEMTSSKAGNGYVERGCSSHQAIQGAGRGYGT